MDGVESVEYYGGKTDNLWAVCQEVFSSRFSLLREV